MKFRNFFHFCGYGPLTWLCPDPGSLGPYLCYHFLSWRYHPRAVLWDSDWLHFAGSGSTSIWTKCKAKLHFLSRKFQYTVHNMKNYDTYMTLTRMIKKCRLSLLWMKVKQNFRFSNICKLGVGSGSGSDHIRTRIGNERCRFTSLLYRVTDIVSSGTFLHILRWIHMIWSIVLYRYSTYFTKYINSVF